MSTSYHTNTIESNEKFLGLAHEKNIWGREDV